MKYLYRNFSMFLAYVIIAFLIYPGFSEGYVMGSGSYRIDSDSINVGGLSFSTSSNYSLGSSIGEIATGYSSSSSYIVGAGFWQPNADVYISISAPGDANIGAISGFLGGTGTASSTWSVATNNPSGYQLTVTANTDPAMQSVDSSIADYVSSGQADYDFEVAADDARFGFSAEGDDIVQKFLDNGSACNLGTNDSIETCWVGFSTTSQVIAESASGNHPTGTDTTIVYRVKIGNEYIQSSSASYEASITVTATTL